MPFAPSEPDALVPPLPAFHGSYPERPGTKQSGSVQAGCCCMPNVPELQQGAMAARK
jgi:hypothetical protein